MAAHSDDDSLALIVPNERPLIGILTYEDHHDVVRYFTDEGAADAAVDEATTSDAFALAGVWGDLEWEALAEALDRIRHDSPPTPPIDL